MYYLEWESWQMKHKAPRYCNYLSFVPPLVFSSKGAELTHGVGYPREELSNCHAENVLILKGHKGHQ